MKTPLSRIAFTLGNIIIDHIADEFGLNSHVVIPL